MTSLPPLFTPIVRSTAHRVLVVALHSEHIARVRSLTGQWPEAPHVEWAKSLNHAVHLALLIQPELVLIDDLLDSTSSRPLEQQLARWCPSADLYSFHDRDIPRTRVRSGVTRELYWDELPMLLRTWLEQQASAPEAQRPALSSSVTDAAIPLGVKLSP